MKFLASLALAATAFASETNIDELINFKAEKVEEALEISPAEITISIEAIDEGSHINQEDPLEDNQELHESYKFENKLTLSLEETSNQAALIIKAEPEVDEVVEQITPETEDLSRFLDQETSTMAIGEKKVEPNAFETLAITARDKQNIGSLLTIMAENNVFKLLFQKKHLEKIGRDISHIHPMRFLGVVFSDPRLVRCMYIIRQSGFKWDAFIDGFSQRFRSDNKAGNIRAYVPGFAQALNVNQSDIEAFINRNDFEGLTVFLMKQKRR